ncbi:ribbon-helix-helix domain-containing protein [Thalassotalea nanhaiensis]|uniref:Ribbon-helix-helix domain-containing protein n=1 Tax=Thalassotalea nanhaiensis TaxID=3065648 RepID=A0ABY9TF87_9GAMM|nr:ribbon-helix-helix domain-containing protein [Colwelliaceae bacterium SQ345]
MSLADLKKQSSTKIKRSFTVDEFIDDSTNYSIGDPQIVSADIQAQTQLLSQKIANSIEPAAEPQSDKPFKHATFTLSEDIIEQLNELAIKTNIPKSRLLRILVNNFYFQDNPNKLLLSKVK